MLQYKVIEQKHRTLLKGRMSAQSLQGTLDAHAVDGWVLERVVTSKTAKFLGLGAKEVFLVIFKREREKALVGE